MDFTTFLIVLLCLWSADALIGDVDHPSVKLPNGYVRGHNNGRYISFESIPYAEHQSYPFEPPIPYSAHWVEPFNATQPPKMCLQWNPFIAGEDKVTGSQDCLTVSIYKSLRNIHRKLPVVVVIHGGFFMFGGAIDDDVEKLMQVGNVIVAKINYRVGPLGFLSTGDSEIPGNFGLKDQRVALKWIKANIAHFGGNSRKILVIGHNAGGASVHLHLLKDNFHTLASAAVSVSGNALDPWALQQGERIRAFELGRILGCGLLNDSGALKLCLVHKSGEEIVRAAQQLQILNDIPLTLFGPVVEPANSLDSFITQYPTELIKNQNSSTVPWIVSYVAQDGGYVAAPFLRKQFDGRELLDQLNHRWYDLAPLLFYYRDSINDLEQLDDYTRDLRQLYMQDKSFSTDTYFEVQRMFTDILFKNGTELSINLHRKYGNAPVYAYLYDYVNRLNPNPIGQWLSQREDIELGAIHGDDFWSVFKNIGSDYTVSENFSNMLENFAKNGHAHYGNCELRNNMKAETLELLHIQHNSCKNLEVDRLP